MPVVVPVDNKNNLKLTLLEIRKKQKINRVYLVIVYFFCLFL